MSTDLASYEIQAHRLRLGFLSETVVEDDDVDAHGVVGVVAALALMAGGAGGTMLATSGSAVAPEPAKLTGSLMGVTGSTAPAIFVSTSTPTKVVYYSSSWTQDSYGPAAGTPCSSAALAKYAVARQVIQVYGNYRRCI